MIDGSVVVVVNELGCILDGEVGGFEWLDKDVEARSITGEKPFDMVRCTNESCLYCS